MKRKLSRAREAALRALHEGREHKTFMRLSGALDRMKADRPRILVLPFRWSKANLAREAEVHITTLLFRERDGTYRCAAILERFETLRTQSQQATAAPSVPEERVKAITQLVREREQELAAQAELICQLRAKVNDLESRDELLADLQKKNAELRESFRALETRCHALSAKLAARPTADDDF